jgi:hypothetical protein
MRTVRMRTMRLRCVQRVSCDDGRPACAHACQRPFVCERRRVCMCVTRVEQRARLVPVRQRQSRERRTMEEE